MAGQRKRRTREHVIADLSVNHVERAILRAGHTVQRVLQDYGFDLYLTTYDANGEIENGLIFLQLKATDRLPLLQDGETIAFPAHRRDLNLWRRNLLPTIFVVYDAATDAAYWLWVQAYLRERYGTSGPSPQQENLTLRLSRTSVLDERTVEQFREWKNERLEQLQQLADGNDDL